MSFFKNSISHFGGDIKFSQKLKFHGNVEFYPGDGSRQISIQHLQFMEVFNFYDRRWIKISVGPANFIEYSEFDNNRFTISHLGSLSIRYKHFKNDINLYIGVGPESQIDDFFNPDEYYPTLRFRFVIPLFRRNQGDDIFFK